MANARMKRIIRLYKFLVLLITIKYKKSKKSLIKKNKKKHLI